MSEAKQDTKRNRDATRAEKLALIPDRALEDMINRNAHGPQGGLIERLVQNLRAARGVAKRFEKRLGQLNEEWAKRTQAGELLDQIPPSNLEAERAVLGSPIYMPTSFPAIRKMLAIDDFYYLEHQTIFAHMIKLDDQRKPIDTVLLYASLRETEDYERVGGAMTIAEILQGCPIPSNFVHYANLVRESSRKRRLIEVAIWLLKQTYGAQAVSVIEAELKQRIAEL